MLCLHCLALHPAEKMGQACAFAGIFRGGICASLAAGSCGTRLGKEDCSSEGCARSCVDSAKGRPLNMKKGVVRCGQSIGTMPGRTRYLLQTLTSTPAFMDPPNIQCELVAVICVCRSETTAAGVVFYDPEGRNLSRSFRRLSGPKFQVPTQHKIPKRKRSPARHVRDTTVVIFVEGLRTGWPLSCKCISFDAGLAVQARNENGSWFLQQAVINNSSLRRCSWAQGADAWVNSASFASMRPPVMYFFLVGLWTSATPVDGFSARSLTSITHQRLVDKELASCY